MTTKPTKSTSKPRNRGTPWDVKDIIKILENTYNAIISNPDEFYYSWLISQQGLSTPTLMRWVEKDDNVKELYTKIKDASECKIGAEMIKVRSKLNPIASMFLLKCKHGWIEKDKDKSLNIQEQAVKNEQMKIKIGFVDEEDQSGNTHQ